MSVVKIKKYKDLKNSVVRNKFEAIKDILDELRESGYCHCFEVKKGSQVVDRIYKVFPKAKFFDECGDSMPCYMELGDEYTIEYKAVERGSYKVDVFKSGEFDYFDSLFKEEFQIPFHMVNQDSVRRLLQKNSREEVVEYLRETYRNLMGNKKVRNVGALFTKKICRGEVQVNPAKERELPKDTEISESVRREIAGIVNYYLDMARIGVPKGVVEKRVLEKIGKFPKELQEEYIEKFRKHVEEI